MTFSMHHVLPLMFFLLASCAGPSARAPGQPEPLPTPRSALFGSFLWQQDGDYAYAMLRPAGWIAGDSGVGRVYAPAPQPEGGRLALSAVNYRGSVIPQNGEDLHCSLFRENSTLKAWSKAVNHALWKSDDVRLELELEDARIYSIRSENAKHLRLVAYVIDQGQPLVVTLEAGGGLADVRRLGELGILDDFTAVVESARAIQRHAGWSSPKLGDRP